MFSSCGACWLFPLFSTLTGVFCTDGFIQAIKKRWQPSNPSDCLCRIIFAGSGETEREVTAVRGGGGGEESAAQRGPRRMTGPRHGDAAPLLCVRGWSVRPLAHRQGAGVPGQSAVQGLHPLQAEPCRDRLVEARARTGCFRWDARGDIVGSAVAR